MSADMQKYTCHKADSLLTGGADGTVVIDDLNQFVQILTAWHSEKVATVQHLREIPDGATFKIGEGTEETTVILSGDTLTGFKHGLEMALMQLGALPFAAELEDAPVAA